MKSQLLKIKVTLTLGLLFFVQSLEAQMSAHVVSNWQIMRSTDKLSNQPFIRKYLPKQLDGRWTKVENTELLSNFADWIDLEYRKPGEDPYYNSWSIPWSTWFLKAPLFDSVKISQGLHRHYKLRLNRLECAEVEVYINEHKLNVLNPTYGQTFIDQTLDITPFLRGDGKDTIFVGFVSQMTNGLSMQRMDHARFTADNEEPSDSIQKLFYGGIDGQLKYDGKVKISPYFRRPIMDFGWDIKRPNIQFGLGNGIECIGWDKLYPIHSEILTDSIVYDAKGNPTAAYVTYLAKLDADFSGNLVNGMQVSTPAFNFVLEKNYIQKIIQQTITTKGKLINKRSIQKENDPDFVSYSDWVALSDTSYELIEDVVEGMRYDSVTTIQIKNKYVIYQPKLWYPNGMFQEVYPKDELPNLYRIGMNYKEHYYNTRSYNSYPYEIASVISSNHYTYTGLRTLAVDTQNGKFLFKVNGRKLTALGANIVWGRENLSTWVEDNGWYSQHGKTKLANQSSPFVISYYINFSGLNLHMYPTTSKPKDKHFRSIFKVGMNMVRFWGGGNYPPEEVYQECDRLGILVWQDLMFSGTTYPQREDWNETVGNELENNISWMKTHPSLALICGNNEIEVALKNWGWFEKYQLHGSDSINTWSHYRSLFDTFIPRKLQNISPNIFYLPSSPVGNWGNQKQMKIGDNHDWGVWHGEHHFNHVDSVNAPFVSEFGFPSFPQGIQESFENNPSRFRSYKGLGLMNEYAKFELISKNKYLVNPKLNTSVLSSVKNSTSGKLQALFLDRAMRAYRTSSKDFGGCLLWQLNDADQLVSWSFIDAWGEHKPAFEQLKYSFKPTISFVRSLDTAVKISLQSTKIKSQKLTLKFAIDAPSKPNAFQWTKQVNLLQFAEFQLAVNRKLLLPGNILRLQVLDVSGRVIDEL